VKHADLIAELGQLADKLAGDTKALLRPLAEKTEAGGEEQLGRLMQLPLLRVEVRAADAATAGSALREELERLWSTLADESAPASELASAGPPGDRVAAFDAILEERVYLRGRVSFEGLKALLGHPGVASVEAEPRFRPTNQSSGAGE